MSAQLKHAPMGGILLSLAAFVIVVAGMRAAEAILVPFLLAVFIAVVLAPVIGTLNRWRVPSFLSVLAVVLALVLAGLLLTALVSSSLDEFTRGLPQYKERFHDAVTGVLSWLSARGIVVSKQVALDYLDPSQAMSVVTLLLGGLGGVLTNGFLILLTVAFILAEASGLPAKLKSAFSDPDASLGHATDVADSINRYMAIKTVFSLLTGILIAIWLWALGVDFWLLWGVLGFLLNFVPNIGSIIAAVPAVLLALVQLGPVPAALTAGGYLVINILIGTFLEPRFMGRGLGLSTLVVFLSLIFWGWVLGPVGMLLSVPLTITVKIILASNEQTRWLAILLGDGKAVTTEQGEAFLPVTRGIPKIGSDR